MHTIYIYVICIYDMICYIYIIYIYHIGMTYKTFFWKIINNPRARQKGKGIYSSVCATSSDNIPVRPWGCEQRAVLLPYATRLGAFHLEAAQWIHLHFCMTGPSLVIWSAAVRMTSSHYIARQLCSWEPGGYSRAIVHFHISFIIEVSEDLFFFCPL